MSNTKKVLIYLPAGSTGFDRRDLEDLFNRETTFHELKQLVDVQSVKLMLWEDFCEIAFGGENADWDTSDISDFVDYANDEAYLNDEDDFEIDNHFGLFIEGMEFLQDIFITVVDVVQIGVVNKHIIDLEGTIQEITNLDKALWQAEMFTIGTDTTDELSVLRQQREKYWKQILRELKALERNT